MTAARHLPADRAGSPSPGASCRRRLATLATGFAALAATLVVAGLPGPVQAQAFPSRPITWVVPYTAGGVTDTGARVVAKAWGEILGVNVLIENKAGAGGMVGTELVAQAKPDGYTVLYASSGPFGANKFLYKKINYDPITSFQPVHSMTESTLVMAVNANTPYKTFAEFVAYAKQHPTRINMGSAGAGTTTHLAGELVQWKADIKLTHIPYKGSAPEILDLLSGQIDVIFDYPGVLKPHIDAGKVRPLATTGAARLPLYADVPTLLELGLKDATITGWSTIAAPAGTPKEVVATLAAAFEKALARPEVVAYMKSVNAVPLPTMAGDALKAFYLSEGEKFKRLVELSGATAQ